jgi:hypothetical protein
MASKKQQCNNGGKCNTEIDLTNRSHPTAQGIRSNRITLLIDKIMTRIVHTMITLKHELKISRRCFGSHFQLKIMKAIAS